MPTNGDATGQEPPISSPDGNGQEPPTSQVSSTSDKNNGGTGSSITTLEDALGALEKARKDQARYRVDAKRLAELEAAEQQRTDAALSEKERYEKKINDLQARLAQQQEAHKQQIARSEIRSQAATLGIKPELALKLLSLDDIEYGEDGDPTNVAELLANVVAELLPQLAPGAPAGQQQVAQQQQPVAPQIRATNPSRDGRAGQIARKDASQMARFGATPGLFKNS